LIEVPDPYMQALDAMEAREAEQSAPLPRPSAADLAEMYGSVDLDLTARLLQAGERDAYTIAAPGHDGRPVIIAEVEHHDIPNPILIGGQPSMSGPWQVPAISGGSQENDTMTVSNHPIRFQVYRLKEDGDTLDTKIAGKIETRDEARAIAQEYSDANNCDTWVYEHRLMQDISSEVIHPCQHDADEPPARFCSQCGHDASPDAPQPTDTGTSHDVPTKYQTTCPTCDQRLVKTENWQRTCAATWSTPETLHGHTSAETAYLVDDYPYGARLRCQIRYWIESGKDGRQRFVSQTCNPKTGKWNNPKKSTYSEVMVMTIDSRGHISYTALGSWPTECEMRRMEALLGEHITEAQASIIRQWRIMNQAQKHITYTVTSTGPLDIMHSAEDRATAAAFDATRQTKEEVNAVWNTAINRAVKELETA